MRLSPAFVGAQPRQPFTYAQWHVSFIAHEVVCCVISFSPNALKLLITILFMHQCLPTEANSFSAGQEIPSDIRNPEGSSPYSQMVAVYSSSE
jgi:hypothetical protein